MFDALVGFSVLLTLALLRLPIGLAMVIVGFFGFAKYVGFEPSMSMVALVVYDTGLTYAFSALPLFILMGNFINRAGISGELYAACNAFLGHKRGGLAIATIVACGGLAAVSGSSLATSATMAKVAMPPMRQYGYADSLATGSIAAGGTLGILIPPSIILVIYGLITESDIGALFIAGIIPGILGVVGYTIAIQVVTRIWPEMGPAGKRYSWRERFVELRKTWGIVTLFAVVMGGIYGGVFTPTEAAGIGASGAFLFALIRRRLTFPLLFEILLESVRTTTMIFIIIIGALVFANFVNIAGLSSGLGEWIQGLNMAPIFVVLVVMLIYIVLGCVLDSLSMILLTVPTFFPLIIGLGYDPIWFGIIVVVVTEISLITPPVGLNVFVLRATVPDVPLATVFRGVTPFWCADIVRLIILVLFPAISLFLPELMFR